MHALPAFQQPSRPIRLPLFCSAEARRRRHDRSTSLAHCTSHPGTTHYHSQSLGPLPTPVAMASSAQHQHDTALAALDAALARHPGCAALMHQRAVLLSAAGHTMAAFVQLRRLGELHPTHPGLQPALQHAAAAVAAQQAVAQHTRAAAPPLRTYVRTNRRSGQAPGAGQQSQEHAHYAALGLEPGASLAEVRASYKQLALQLHPDRQGAASSEQRAQAEERCKRVTAAYAAIVSEHA